MKKRLKVRPGAVLVWPGAFFVAAEALVVVVVVVCRPCVVLLGSLLNFLFRYELRYERWFQFSNMSASYVSVSAKCQVLIAKCRAPLESRC